LISLEKIEMVKRIWRFNGVVMVKTNRGFNFNQLRDWISLTNEESGILDWIGKGKGKNFYPKGKWRKKIQLN